MLSAPLVGFSPPVLAAYCGCFRAETITSGGSAVMVISAAGPGSGCLDVLLSLRALLVYCLAASASIRVFTSGSMVVAICRVGECGLSVGARTF